MSKESRDGNRGGDVPGPGSYHSDLRQSGPAYSMRNKDQSRASESQPGPGAYEPSYIKSKTSAPSYKMGEKPAYNASTNSPGPGAYEIKDHKSKTQAWTMGNRHEGPRGEAPPGPGAYNVEPKGTAPAYSISCRDLQK